QSGVQPVCSGKTPLPYSARQNEPVSSRHESRNQSCFMGVVEFGISAAEKACSVSAFAQSRRFQRRSLGTNTSGSEKWVIGVTSESYTSLATCCASTSFQSV